MTCRMEPRESKHKGMINHHRQEAKRTQLSILNNAIGKNSQEIKLSHSNTEKKHSSLFSLECNSSNYCFIPRSSTNAY